MHSASSRSVFDRGTWAEASRIAAHLRNETIGGVILLGAAVLAFIWANTPWRDAYHSLSEWHIGPSSWGLSLTLAHWAADGLLAVFFLVVGLELKHEFVHGDLRDPARATIPVIAAACGVAMPAILYVIIQQVGDGDLQGWAIPTATDIAFALAVLAAIDSHLPSRMRSFLLTLAVVDDLIAIIIIALFYGHGFAPLWLLGTIVPLALFALVVRKWPRLWPLLAILAIATWVCMFKSGIHATIAGVLLGFAVPVGIGDSRDLTSPIEHRLRPFSSGFCVPLFAFFSAGVTVVGTSLRDTFTDPITLGVVIGLVLGKVLGVFGGTWIGARVTRARLDHNVVWRDVFGLSLLAGIGFTVSLLIGELAYGVGSEQDDHVRLGILSGSVLAAILASIVLVRRNKAYRLMHEEDERDDDGDGVPDVYQSAHQR